MINVLNIVATAFCLYLYVVIRRIPIKGPEHLVLSLAAIALFEFNAVAYVIYQAQSVQTLNVLIPIATIGAFAFVPLQLHFAYLLLRARPIPVAWLIPLYGPPVFFAILNFVHPFSLLPTVSANEVILNAGAGLPINIAWFVYVSATWLSAVCLYGVHSRSARAARERRQSTLLATGAALSLGLIVAEFNIPLVIEDWSIPSQSPLLLTLWMGAMVYGVWRYGLLRISPRLMAEQILNSIEDLVLLYDMNGRRSFVNQKAAAVLGPTTAIKRPDPDPFADPVARVLATSAQWSTEEPERQFRATVAGADDCPLLVHARVKPAFDRFNDPIGVVVSANVVLESVSVAERYRLTERESEVLQYLASGLSIGRTASALSITARTVKAHITHVYQKTGAANRVELLNMIGCAPGAEPSDTEA